MKANRVNLNNQIFNNELRERGGSICWISWCAVSAKLSTSIGQWSICWADGMISRELSVRMDECFFVLTLYSLRLQHFTLHWLSSRMDDLRRHCNIFTVWASFPFRMMVAGYMSKFIFPLHAEVRVTEPVWHLMKSWEMWVSKTGGCLLLHAKTDQWKWKS